MEGDIWRAVLVSALALNAVVGFAYRVYRLSRGGPMADVIGQAILALLLLGLAVAAASGAGFATWGSLVYAVLFGLVVMPLWVVAVLIPLEPGGLDYVFTGVYWAGLAVIALAALAV